MPKQGKTAKAGKAGSTKTPWVTVKMTRTSHEDANQLIQMINENGWSQFGIDRKETPTLGLVIEVALKKLRESSP